MKKLIILKSLVDFIWIVTCLPIIPILLFFCVFMFVNPESLNVVFDTTDAIAKAPEPWLQIIGLLLVILVFVGIYCFYLFRKTLRYFQKVKPFHNDVIFNFNRIGKLLSAIGFFSMIIIFVSRMVFENHVKINLGISPYLILICLGLFFMVLSEVFKVAKYAKEENDLTV